MASLPNWLPGYLVAATVVHLAAYFIGSTALSSTSGNVFTVIQSGLNFNVPGIPSWLQWGLFFVFTLPLLLLLASFLFDLFQNSITGAIVGIGVILGGLATLLL